MSPQYAKPGPYITKLNPQDETQFQTWVKLNGIPFDPGPTADYDMRGFWQARQAGASGGTQISQFDQRPHFPDTFKTPYHKTFSNESKYATPDAPRWLGDRLVDRYGQILADETPPMIKNTKDISWNIMNPPAQDRFAGQGISAQPNFLESLVHKLMGR